MPQRIKKIKLEKKEEYKFEIESDIEDEENEEEESENDCDEPTHLSPYEKMIMKNKQEKMKFLQTLQINEAKQSFTDSVRKIKPVRKPVKKVFKKSKPSFTPIRKSRRLANLDVDFSEDALFNKAINEAKTEQDGYPKEDIPLQLSFNEALKDTFESFSNNIKSQLLQSVEDFKSIQYAKTLFKDLKLSEDNVAKVVPTRITAMDIHPHPQNIIVCAGSKRGSIGFWNVLTDSDPFLCRPHSEGITNIKFNPFAPSKVISSSYDGSLRCGDMGKEMFEEIHASEACLTYFDFLSEPVFLVSQKNGSVSIVDTRRHKKAVNHSCHDYSVKTVSVHPQEKSYFVTSDSKGAIRVWDLRKLQEQPIANINQHKRTINSAFFSPVTGKYILSTSLDDTVAILDSSVVSKDIRLKASIRHNNCTGRWLTQFRATWLPNSDEYFVIGSMGHPRQIEVLDHELNHAHNYIDENLNSICCVNVFHPNKLALAGANSSGKVYVFMS